MNDDQNHLFPEPIDPKQPRDSQQNGNQYPNNGSYQDGQNPNSQQEYYPQNTNQSNQYTNDQVPVYNNPITPSNQQQQQNYEGQEYTGYQDQQPSYDNFDIGQDQQTQVEVQKTINKDASKGDQNPSQKKSLKQKITNFLATKWWVVVVILLILSVIGGTIFYFVTLPPSYDSSAFTTVNASIEAPSASPSGSPNRWKVLIQNKESVAIRNIEVKLNFDRSFQYLKPINPDPSSPSGNTYRFDSLAGLGQGTSEVIIQFDGVLTGNIDESTLMSGSVTYTPAPLIDRTNPTRTIAITEAQTKITAPQINVNLTAISDTVQNGGEVQLTATFENLSEKDLSDVRIAMEYPSGSNFVYLSSALTLRNTDVKTQPDDGRNIWFTPVLPRLQSSTLTVKGNLFGADGVRQTFRIEISSKAPNGNYQPLATDVIDVLVTSQPLIISTKIAGKDSSKSFAPGDTLTVDVTYQNKSNTTIQNVELFGLIDDPANLLDYSTANFVGGNIGNLNNRVINWRGSGVPQLITLTPQVSGTVSYTIRVKAGDKFIESGLNQSSYTIRPRAQAKATNLPQFEVGGDLYQGKGDLIFTQEIEPLAIDPNQANKQNFLVTWEVRTRQNQVNDVTIQTISPLPPTSWNQTTIKPGNRAGELSYDPLTGKIVWTPGNVIGYTGISNPVRSISFEITVVAGPNTSINNTTIYDTLTATGIDDFTGEKYQVTNSPTRANN